MTIKLKFAALLPALLATLFISTINTTPAAAQTRADDLRDNATEGSRRNSRPSRRNVRAPQLSAEEVMASAQTHATAAGISCQVTQANLLGQIEGGHNLFEIACATGPGYLVSSSTPPIASDCVLLSAAAETSRANDPAADVGPQCVMPANLDSKRFITEYAASAGVTCTVDDGAVVGRAVDGGIVYEIGCAGSDGYHIKNANGAWTKDECLQVITQNGACRFTTAAEQAATVKSWLAGTDAATCDVEQTRLMGQNANGRFYEVKCTAADGYIARVNAERVVQQVYPCATSQQIGGGCTLTTSAPAAPSAPSAPSAPAAPAAATTE